MAACSSSVFILIINWEANNIIINHGNYENPIKNTCFAQSTTISTLPTPTTAPTPPHPTSHLLTFQLSRTRQGHLKKIHNISTFQTNPQTQCMEIQSASVQHSSGGNQGPRATQALRGHQDDGHSDSGQSGGYWGLTTEVPLMASPSRCPPYSTVYPGAASASVWIKNFGLSSK